MKKFGIDVSRWQRGFNFQKAKAEGVEFVIIKSSQADFIDSQFENHYKNAKAAGLGVGAYHFCTATNISQAKMEAATCIKAIKGKTFEYPIYLDFENSSGVKYVASNKANNTAIVKAFCSELEAAGYWAGIYMNHNFYKNVVDGPALANKFSIWIASWGSVNPVEEAKMWQFGGEINRLRSNKIAGVVCDQDYCFEDYPSLIKEKGLNGFTKQPPKKSIDELVDEVIAGKWGNGSERKERLTEAGYDYNAIQAGVNEKMSEYKPEIKVETPEQTEIIYIVKKGDTLSRIASKYKTTYQKLAEYNKIENPNRIYVGQKIKIPN